MLDPRPSHDPLSQRARPGAHPVPGRRLPAAIPFARLAARTAPHATRAIATARRTGTLAELHHLQAHARSHLPPRPHAGANTCMGRREPRPVVRALRAHRRQGQATVPRPAHSDRALHNAGPPAGRAARSARTSARHRRGIRAEHALASRYGSGRALFEHVMDLMRVDMCYPRSHPVPGHNQCPTAHSSFRNASSC